MSKHFQKGNILHFQRADPSWLLDRVFFLGNTSQLLLADPEAESEPPQQLLRLPPGLLLLRGEGTRLHPNDPQQQMYPALHLFSTHRETHPVCPFLKEILYCPTRPLAIPADRPVIEPNSHSQPLMELKPRLLSASLLPQRELHLLPHWSLS